MLCCVEKKRYSTLHEVTYMGKPMSKITGIINRKYGTERYQRKIFDEGVIAATNDLIRPGGEREFGAEKLRELRAFYPGLFAEMQEQNVDANLKLQETMNFDMDRFREEGDPWTQAGVDAADFNVSVPYGFGGYGSMFGYGNRRAGGMATKDRAFMPGGRVDNPYYIAHEGRHLTTPGVGGHNEEMANHQVDLNLANRFGNAKVADNALRFIAREGGKRAGPVDAMEYQRKYGKPSAFAKVDYENEPEIMKGKVNISRQDMDKASPQELYEIYRNADQFTERRTVRNKEQIREHPDVGWFDTYLQQHWRFNK